MDNSAGRSYNLAPFSYVHKKIAAGTFMGMFCDGYTLRIIGVYLAYAQQPLNLSSFWVGLIGSGSMFGMFIGSLVTGMITDRFGRKQPYWLCMLFLMLLSLWQYWLLNPLLLVIARVLLGVIIGSDYTVGITLLSEWAPDKSREKITSGLIVFWMIGYCLAYAVSFFVDGMVALFGNSGLRLVLCTSAVPAFIALLLRVGSPESPVWLVAKHRKEEAEKIVKKYLGQFWSPNQECQEDYQTSSWFALFYPQQWRKTVVSCVFYLAQVVPFFAISIFLPLVLQQMHVENPDISGMLYNVLTLLGVFIGFLLYTNLTRRTFLLGTFYVSAGILAIIVLWRSMPAMIGLILVGLFALVLAASLIPEFTYPAELFPTELRASGVGLTVAISNIGAGIGTFLLPVISENFGIHAALSFCVCILLFGAIICQMWIPRTVNIQN